VRERWCTIEVDDTPLGNVCVGYPAGPLVDWNRVWIRISQEEADRLSGANFSSRVRAAKFMPRWASRIHLAVTSVRVERLQDISEGDAKAEGIAGVLSARIDGSAYRTAFARRWEEANGKRAPWASNPWVWVVGFRVLPGGAS
jgi:hypothetical protein